ncbi:MAG: hypothetical protein FWD66_00250 [Paludibacter sp.]|nr:hypothetical protein [Paludibacter sp.]
MKDVLYRKNKNCRYHVHYTCNETKLLILNTTIRTNMRSLAQNRYISENEWNEISAYRPAPNSPVFAQKQKNKKDRIVSVYKICIPQ